MKHPDQYPTLHPYPFTDVTSVTPDGAYWQQGKFGTYKWQGTVVGPMLPPIFYRMALEQIVGHEMEWISQSFMAPESLKIADAIRDRGIVSFIFQRKVQS